MGSGFVRGNYYHNKDTYKLTHEPMNPYNMKIISSCFKLTPNSVRTPEMASRAMEAFVAPIAAITMAIAETADLLILHS